MALKSLSEDTANKIVGAFITLLNKKDFADINIKDVCNQANVGRATFYRYFKRKEDVILYYFENNTKPFITEQFNSPQCKEDYTKIITELLSYVKQYKEPFRLLCKAHLEYIYSDFLNNLFVQLFQDENSNKSYTPCIHAGMLFNISMAWLDNDCEEDINDLADMIANTIESADRQKDTRRLSRRFFIFGHSPYLLAVSNAHI